jgi:orotidine-5'-phosphate decarboxylase
LINTQEIARKHIIVALDVPTLSEAVALTGQLQEHVHGFKVGLQLLSAEGSSEVVSALGRLGVRIFYDAKFSDIPNTVASASRAVSDKGVWMFDVHASAGRAAIEAAANNKGNSKLLAITVLTSLSSDECTRVFGRPSLEKVVEFARLASHCGADGVVCAQSELEAIKESKDTSELLCVVPGIRPKWAATADQSRYATPKLAISGGADYLVIGRPITRPPSSVGSPVEATMRIAEEICEAE